MSQQTAFEYLAHGQIPFFRLRSVPLSVGVPDAARAVLLGAPYDGGATYRPGSRFAPYEVRRVSALVQGYHPVHSVSVFDKLGVVDGGNVVFPPFDAARVRSRIESAVDTVLAANAVPFVVGGDHSIALPILRALAKRHGPLAVVHLDAHLDMSGPEMWSEDFHHGTSFRHALEEGLIARGQLHQVGVRGPARSARDRDLAAEHGAHLISSNQVAECGAASVAGEICKRVADRPVYLSFDVDVVDPAYAPGTGTPVPGGLSSREALQFLQGLAVKLVGMDLVEVCPALDHADMTSCLAAHILFEGLSLAALAA